MPEPQTVNGPLSPRCASRHLCIRPGRTWPSYGDASWTRRGRASCTLLCHVGGGEGGSNGRQRGSRRQEATAAMAAAAGTSAASGLARGAAARAAEERQRGERQRGKRWRGRAARRRKTVRRWRLPAVLVVFRSSYEARLDGEVVVRTEDVCGDDLYRSARACGRGRTRGWSGASARHRRLLVRAAKGRAMHAVRCGEGRRLAAWRRAEVKLQPYSSL